MSETAIEWTQRSGTKGETWNPTIGCSRASEGCEHCYAEAQAGRIVRMTPGKGAAVEYAKVVRENKRGLSVWNGEVTQLADRLDVPLRARDPRTYFVNSMSDLFHERIPDAFIMAAFATMAACQHHTFIVLTKRAERMEQVVDNFYGGSLMEWTGLADEYMKPSPALARKLYGHFKGDLAWSDLENPPLPNVWLGVSAENQRWFNERVPHLLCTPAAVRLVSLEPLLGPIDLSRWVFSREEAIRSAMRGPAALNREQADDSIDHPLDWVIVGGESGPNRRDCNSQWIESIVEQCAEAGTACFVKQDSARKPGQRGRLSDRAWATKQFPERRETGQ